MLAEAINKILSLAPFETQQIEGVEYADRKLYPIARPMPEPLKIASLSGLIDYQKQLAENDSLYVGLLNPDTKKDRLSFHVVSHREVKLIGSLSNNDRCREVLAIAKTLDAPGSDKEIGFDFGRWHDSEQFIIGLQAHFHRTAMLDEILKLVSSMSTHGGAKIEDNGVSQSVSVMRGVVLKGMASVPNPVSLAPRRGFHELFFHESQFVFRVRYRDDDSPQCALFEGDGGAWQQRAREDIKDWLKGNSELPVIA